MTKYEMRSRDFTEFTLGTLASLTAIIAGTKIDATRLQGCSVEKVRYSTGIIGKTGGVSEGPVAFGLSMGNTITEIAAFYAADPQSQSDELELAWSQLPIIELGRYQQNASVSTTTPAQADLPLRHGKWGGWPIRQGIAMNHYVFNLNPNDALTTGGVLQLYTELLGEWRQD